MADQRNRTIHISLLPPAYDALRLRAHATKGSIASVVEQAVEREIGGANVTAYWGAGAPKPKGGAP